MSLRPFLSMLRAAIPVLALLASTRAAAQTTNITLDISGKSAWTVNKDDCAATLTINWSVAVSGATSCKELVIWVTKAASCATAPTTEDYTVGTVTGNTWITQGSGSFTLSVSNLPVFSGTTCPVLNLEQEMRVCAYAQYSSLTTTCSPALEAKSGSSPTILYDTKAPAAPTITSVVPQDGALQILFTAPSDASSVTVAYSDVIGPYTRGPEVTASSGSLKLDGLTNGVTYAVLLYAEDLAGNQSSPSGAESGTPVASYGFFANYQNAGGAEQGGCAAVPAAACPWLVLAWAGTRLARRRRQSPGRPSRAGATGLGALAGAIFALLALLPAPALAQQPAGTMERPASEFGSERTAAVEVKLGGFKPLVGQEATLSSNPYDDTFGDNPMLLLQVSGERQLFQAFGTAGVGFSAGYAEKFAPAHLANGTVASESTGLRLFPLQLFGVYRFDYAAHTWGIPVVPYVKAGLNCTIWSSSKGTALETTASGGVALGGRWGWGFSGGLALLLDVFEPRLARDFDTDTGVNHSYLFAELNYADVSNFYTPGLDLSGRYAMFGIAFEL